MTLPGAVAMLAQRWDDVADRLGEEQRRLLASLVSDLLSGSDAARGDAALDIMELASEVLPADHPVRRALAVESSRFQQGTADQDTAGWGPALLALSPRLAEIRTAIRLGAAPAEVQRQAEHWVLEAPALDPAEVRRRGGDPLDPALIRLDSASGDARLPAFQFGADGLPYPVVTAINLLLDAQDDPWGVADWWLGPNAWIGAVPAEVIGRIDDQVLIEAARAVFEEA